MTFLAGNTTFKLLGFTALCSLIGCGPSGDTPTADVTQSSQLKAAAAIQPLSTAIQRIEDIRSIKRLQRAYGYYIDAGQWDAVADLFSEQGEIELGLMGQYLGRDRVRDFLYAKYGNGAKPGLRDGQLNEHFQLQPVIHLSEDGQSATGRWRDFGMLGIYKKFAAFVEGPYENRYVKENGVWKIASLHWYETFIVPYAGGWKGNESLTAARTQLTDLPPDLPPSETYESWPGVYLPPFHYQPQDIGAVMAVPEVDATDKALVTLRDRVARLADEEAIENLISAYGYYLDKNRWDDLVELFDVNATAEIAQRGVYKGRARIREMLELFGPQGLQPNHLHNHIQVQPVIHVSADGQTAWARSRAISQLGEYKKYGIWGDGIYENTFIKVDGVWKIKTDHIYTAFFSDYDEGFSGGARPVPGISDKLPPDAPPTDVYASFPSVSVPPFHYANPVSGQPIHGSDPVYRQTAATPVAYKGELAALDARVTQLEDETAVANLQRTYGFLVDKALWKEVSNLFAADGTLEIGGARRI